MEKLFHRIFIAPGVFLCQLLIFLGPLSGQSWLVEDFSSGMMPPEGWTLESMEGQWAASPSSYAGGDQPEASFKWIQELGTSRLISPSINLSPDQSYIIEFKYWYDDYLGEGPSIGVATRSGNSLWTSIWEITPEDNSGPDLISLPLTTPAGSLNDFQFCFYLDGDMFNLDYWYIDDVRLHTPQKLFVKFLLEGPENKGGMSSSLNDLGYLPLAQPYDCFPWYYTGEEVVEEIPATGITDWILIDFWKREPGEDPEFTLKTRQAGFLRSDGRICGLDGFSPISYPDGMNQNIHIWIHHRNHFSVMSSGSLNSMGDNPAIDFSSGQLWAMEGNSAMKQLAGGHWVVMAGDGNGDGRINTYDMQEVWTKQVGQTGYRRGDFNLDGIVDTKDIKEVWQSNQGAIRWNPDTVGIPFICGDTLVDGRDGQAYATVQIGSQCWMAQNLNYATAGSLCYDNILTNCDTYGRLYNWYNMMNGSPSSNLVPSGVQGVCPEGWHVPSDAEYCIMTDFVDNTIVCDTSGYNGTDCGTKLKSVWGWSSEGNGTNESGFNALPGGCMGIYHFDDLFLYSYHWTASDDYPGFSLLIKLNYGMNKLGRYFSLKNRYYSVRCVKD